MVSNFTISEPESRPITDDELIESARLKLVTALENWEQKELSSIGDNPTITSGTINADEVRR